jgi:hypothetical protein
MILFKAINTSLDKATGLGISEFMLRYMTWVCLKDDTLKGTHMCIVTGARIDLAITLIDRMKQLFRDKQLLPSSFDTKETIRISFIHRELQTYLHSM